jgi:hypothetical protein
MWAEAHGGRPCRLTKRKQRSPRPSAVAVLIALGAVAVVAVATVVAGTVSPFQNPLPVTTPPVIANPAAPSTHVGAPTTSHNALSPEQVSFLKDIMADEWSAGENIRLVAAGSSAPMAPQAARSCIQLFQQPMQQFASGAARTGPHTATFGPRAGWHHRRTPQQCRPFSVAHTSAADDHCKRKLLNARDDRGSGNRGEVDRHAV